VCVCCCVIPSPCSLFLLHCILGNSIRAAVAALQAATRVCAAFTRMLRSSQCLDPAVHLLLLIMWHTSLNHASDWHSQPGCMRCIHAQPCIP
jgi:hypothetical protein